MFWYPYLILFIIIFSFSFISYGKKTEFSISLNFFSFLILFVFLGFRGFVSTDWFNYYPAYERAQEWRLWDYPYLKSFNWEYGSVFFLVLMKKIGCDYFGYCLVSATIDLIVLNKFFSEYSENKCFSWVLFILFSGITIEFNLLRNSKAIDCFLISLKYINKNKIKYLLLNILGIFFHMTAIVFVLFYFVYKTRFYRNKRLVLFLWLFGMFIYIVKIPFIETFVLTIADFLPGRLAYLAKRYTVLNTLLTSYGFGFGFIERTVTFLIVFNLQDKILKKESNGIFVALIYVYFFCFLYLAEIFQLAVRITNITIMGYWILIPYIVKDLPQKKKLYFFVIFFFYAIIKLYAIYANDVTMEYENWLFGKVKDYNERYSENFRSYLMSAGVK